MHILHAFYDLSINMTQLQWRGPQVRSRAGGPLSLAALGLGWRGWGLSGGGWCGGHAGLAHVLGVGDCGIHRGFEHAQAHLLALASDARHELPA